MWPELPLKKWQETYDTLHMWTQVVGKIALKLNPFLNHWWQCSLKITPRGLTTGMMPYKDDAFDISFDFIDHVLSIRTSHGKNRYMSLSPKSVADFYFELLDLLHSLYIDIQIDPLPKEVPSPIPFNEDQTHRAYDREFAFRHWYILLQTEKVLERFRSFFIGKSSPVQFFWGSFDLTVSLFSGRPAPPRPKADHITQVGYSHEDYACGFWPGSGNIQAPAFYAYISPEPPGFKSGLVEPKEAFYNEPTQGYILYYDDVRESLRPEDKLLTFFMNTYALGADLAKWDRKKLEMRVNPH